MNNINIKEKLFETAFRNEEMYGGCAQCTLSSINEHIFPISNDTFKSATSLAAGFAGTYNVCGACSGGVMAIGSLIGRDYENFSTEQGVNNKTKTNELSKKLIQKFKDVYGSVLCCDIQKNLYGKCYDFTSSPEEKESFCAAGAYGEDGCTKVCGNAAVWTYEILKEAELI